MNNLSSVITGLFLALTFSAFAQRQPHLLCIVQTKPNPAVQYDPSAGRYAIAMDKQLEGRRLPDGTPLAITVLAASVDQAILPEVRRLNCSWVLQLWFHRSADNGLYGGGYPIDIPGTDPEPEVPFPQAIGDQNSLIFALWDAATRKVFARGAAPLVHSTHVPGERPWPTTQPYVALRNQILHKLKLLP